MMSTEKGFIGIMDEANDEGERGKHHGSNAVVVIKTDLLVCQIQCTYHA